jgi:hypothetical protein
MNTSFWVQLREFQPWMFGGLGQSPEAIFFAWLVLHNRVLTADNMIIKNWPCNPICSLCSCLHETTSHILTECNFTEATWNLVAPKFNLPGYVAMSQVGKPVDWVRVLAGSRSAIDRKLKLGILITFWWMV